LIEILFLSIFLLFFGSTIIAERQTTYSWIAEQAYLTAQFTPATRCMSATGNNTLTVTVYKYPDNALDTGAIVSATVTKPDNTTANINFANQGDGNYTNTYDFDANGTWKFSVTATHAEYTDGAVESYVYVGDFNLLVSFVNNNQNVYDRYTGSVRNLVTNIDGNYFTGIDGNVTIYYPSSSAWVSNAAMTESSDGNGEYYYNFTAPTTLGTYSATSTFACGSNSDSNSAGRFTVVASCGNGTCNSWEDCSSCSADCGTCPTTPTTLPGGGGGGGGGGVAPPETPPSGPKILSWQFDETPKMGGQSSIIIKISNPAKGRNFLLSTEISQVKEIGYSETQQVLGVRANETRSIILEEKYAPKIAGTQTIEIKLLSDDRHTVYDELVDTFDIAGMVRYDVSIECLDEVARIGSKANASITLLNLGDYYKDVELRWWIEDSNGKQIGLASLPIALYANESRSIVRSVNIPVGSKKGQYSFKAVVDYKGQKTEAFCNFITEESVEYYRKIIEAKEGQLDELNDLIQSKKEQGYDVAEIEKKISEARIIISLGKTKIGSGDLSELDNIVAKLDVAIEEITRAKKDLETEVYLALPQVLIALALILLIIVALILYLLKGLADELLGLKEQKKEEDKEKEWKQLDALLGLQEHKKEKINKGKTKQKKSGKAKRKPKKKK
jgi:hypothetical protein